MRRNCVACPPSFSPRLARHAIAESRDTRAGHASEGQKMPEHILRRPDVEARTGLSRSTIYELMTKGEFPKQVRLSARAVGWRESDVVRWLESRQSGAA